MELHYVNIIKNLYNINLYGVILQPVIILLFCLYTGLSILGLQLDYIYNVCTY